MDAITLLKEQHKKAKKALKTLQQQYDAKVLNQLADELSAHMIIEETIFYHAAVQADPDMVLESYEEHACAQFALKRLLSTKSNDPRFEARAKALYDLIHHHVEEEEEKLFPHARKKLDHPTLVRLGKQMSAKFDELVERGHKKTLPTRLDAIAADDESRDAVGEIPMKKAS
jgi:hemerythrin-like domain-containing protein